MADAPILEYETPLKPVPNEFARWSFALGLGSISWCFGLADLLRLIKEVASRLELLSYWGAVVLVPSLAIIFGVLAIVQIRRSHRGDRRGTVCAIAGVAIGTSLIPFCMWLTH